MSIFKAYDIRGIYNDDFDKNIVYKIGYYLPEIIEAEKALIGYDIRKSSPEIFDYLTKGLQAKGIEIYSMDLATTPSVYFNTFNGNFNLSIQITASHNSKEYNGMKISKKEALPVGYDNGLDELERLVNNSELNVKEAIKRTKNKIIRDYNGQYKYLNFLKKRQPEIDNLDILIDSSNGMASLFLKDIFNEKVDYINYKMDGDFPNHDPNPMDQNNLTQIKEKIKNNNYDIGVVYDGDGDRVIFLDEKGRFVSPDLITAILAEYFLKGNNDQYVLYDIRTSRSVKEYIEKLGGKPYMWKVGHAYAKLKMRELDAVVGGELAGHYYFRDFHYCDSGLLTSFIVLNVINEYKKETGFSLSKVIDEIDSYMGSGEINFKIEDKKYVMKKVVAYFKEKAAPLKIYDFDGYRLEFKDWWFNIRPSNTEPYLRLVVEADNTELLNNKVSLLNELIES
ncbi:MAG: phosphomannomutase/phosphoglucomutase [Halanaerobiales bacterium]|nr:phosphomannomutase/phosphoglucomutase [Halanaerobiales bacterium]